ncbi:VOC family protein [Streptomyces sp. NPDC093252]|uniref:VOC family protein n=1 Tax=Streptomyces sp. NPDC093252 TaxID=3154980 RepID=UPI0034321CB0
MTVRWTHAFIDRPADRLDAALAFWTAVTGTRTSGPRGDRGEFTTLLPDPGTGADACLKAQGTASGPGGAHLDFAVDDVDAFTARALRLGARTSAAHDGWTVLRSPAGHAFCAVPWHGEAVRPPVVGGSQLDQVCLDTPPSAYDAEAAFWTGLLTGADGSGWESVSSPLPEFRAIVPPAGLPVRVLLQRLGTEQPAAAHPDLACADLDATAAAHERLGATVVRRHPFWTVLRDPAGGTYCLTGRDPETGGRPKSA